MGSRTPEQQPLARPAMSMFACLAGSVPEAVTSLFGGREGSQSPLRVGQGAGRSDVPGHQPPAPLPGLSPTPSCIIYLPLTQS